MDNPCTTRPQTVDYREASSVYTEVLADETKVWQQTPLGEASKWNNYQAPDKAWLGSMLANI
jgi:hypothetical protein